MRGFILCAIAGFTIASPCFFAQTDTPGTLQQLAAQLQKSPSDQALREKIIALAHEQKTPPELPDEAERRMARGAAAFKAAQSVADYKDAVEEFTQATLAAPWYGDAYFNLGLAEDKAEQYDAALRSLRLALLASPGSKEIKDLMYQVEYRVDQANTPEGKAKAEYGPAQGQFATLMEKLDGKIFTYDRIYLGLHFYDEVHFYKSGRYHLLMCDLRQRTDNLHPLFGQDGHGDWENKAVGDYVMPTNGRDAHGFLFYPDSGQEFFKGCGATGAGRLSADGTTMDRINNYSREHEVSEVWHRQ